LRVPNTASGKTVDHGNKGAACATPRDKLQRRRIGNLALLTAT